MVKLRFRLGRVTKTRSSYQEAVSTLHCVLENRYNLHVNERQKIRDYRARSTEEYEERRRMPNRNFLLRAVHAEIVLLWRCYKLNRLETAVEHNGGV